MSDSNNVDLQQLSTQADATVSDNVAAMIQASQQNQNLGSIAGEYSTWIRAGEEILQNLSLFSTQAYTPGSDLDAGSRQNQLIWGRDGNDTFIGLDPVVANNPAQPNIDGFLAHLEWPPLALEAPRPRDWSNSFILGDWKDPYYAKAGENDFAVLLDFNPTRDTIQLHGTPEDYRLVQSSVGTQIWLQQGTGADLIGLVPFVSNLSLEGDYFKYEGYTPPEGPVVGQIQQFGNDGFNLSSNVTTDPLGNAYVAGGTTGSLGGPNAGSRDAFVTKYDSNGNQVWVRQLGTSSFDTAYGVATDQQDNVYLSGTTEGNLGGIKQASGSDAWVAKYDSNGNQQWIRQFGSDLLGGAFRVAVGNDGNVYLTGTTVKAAEQGAASPVEDVYWTAKYDNNGNRLWYTEFGAPNQPNTFNESYGLAVDKDNNVYTTGWTLGNLAAVNAGLYDVWITKQDTNGNQQWTKQFGTNDYEWSWGVSTDSNDNVYATGWTLGNLGGVNAGSYDAWLTKYDTNGNQQWIQQFGTSGDDEATGVKVDSQDNIFVTGFTDNNLGGANAGSYDAWVAEYDSNGNQKWIKQIGTSKADIAYSVNVDNAGQVYVTGVTEGSLGGTNSGSVDGWVAKLDAGSGNLENFTGTTAPGNASDGRPFSNRDLLTSTNGNDRIVSLPGQNIITLAGGSDTITYNSYKGGNDSITNFSAADDRIDLSQIFAGRNYSSTSPFNDYVKLVQMGSTTQVQINPAGDSHNIFTTLVTLNNVNATDLTANNFVV